VHEKVSVELRARELSTFHANQRLQSQELELKASHKNISEKLALYEAQDISIRNAVDEIAQELPACEIQPDLPLVEKVQIIGGRVKTLEHEIVAMAEDHRTQISELEARVAAHLTDDSQQQFEALRRTSTQLTSRAGEAENLMNQAMEAWTELETLPFKIGLLQQVQGAEQSLTVLTEEAKALEGLAKMRKMSEVRRIQQQLHKLRNEDAKLTNSIQPFMDEYADLAAQIEAKIKEIAESQQVIDGITKEEATAETVQTAVECVDELDSAIAQWKKTLAETQAKADAQIKRPHASASGSRASHK
jgi:archaellum component FlaC